MPEDRLRIVLDTNVLLVSISSRSKYHWIFQSLLAERFTLFISNEILAEYEEILGDKYDVPTAKNVVRTLLVLPNVRQIRSYFRWNLIAVDPDDNKFVDCAVAANAHVLVTEDRDFRVLDQVDFPRIRCIGIAQLETLLKHRERSSS